MRLPLGALLDPPDQRRLLVPRQREVANRAPASSRFGSVLRMRRPARSSPVLPGHDGAMARRQRRRSADLFAVEPQPAFAHAIVRTVALEAAVRQDRLDVEVEVDDVGQSSDGRCGGPPAATARHHGQCEHNGTRGQMPKDQRDCHPGSKRQEADYRTLTPGRGALEDEKNDPAPT